MFTIKQLVRLKVKKAGNILQPDLAHSLVEAGAAYGHSKLS